MSLESRPEYQVVLEVVFASLLAVASATLNLRSCYIVWKNPLLRTWHNLFTINLIVIDLVCTVLSTSFTILVLGYGKWPLGDTMCYMSGYINAVVASAIINTLALFSYSRYQLFACPRKYLMMWNKKRCLIAIGIVWFIALAISLPPVVGWGKYTFLKKNAVCFLNFNNSQSFSAIYIYVSLAAPLTFAVVYLVRLYIALRNHNPLKSEQEESNNIQFRKTLRAAKSMLGLALGFFLCWIPAFVVYALDAADVYLSRGPCLVSTFMCYTFGLILPLIYASTSSEFKIGYHVNFRVKKKRRCSVNPEMLSEGYQSNVSRDMNERPAASVHRENTGN